MSKTNCKVMEQRMEMELDESVGGGVFPTYYVQSPSTISHANSCNNNLSRSSSRASNNNNINNNITTPAPPTTCSFDHHQYPNAAAADEMKRLINNSSSSTINEYGSTYYDGGGWWKYLSFRYSPNSTAWIILQVTWRFLLSLGIALLVFYMATKPPNPNISIKVSKVREYEVGEGVDGTGVSTKILNCNISLHLFIHNPSNLFPLHIQSPLLQLSFGTLSLASTPIHGKDEEEEEVKVERWERKVMEVEVGSKDRLMYGGGGAMEDMVESGQGLTLTIRASLHSSYHLVGSLVVAKFHHQALCLLVLFRGAGSTLPSTTTTSHRFYDKRHRTIVYNTTCLFIPT